VTQVSGHGAGQVGLVGEAQIGGEGGEAALPLFEPTRASRRWGGRSRRLRKSLVGPDTLAPMTGTGTRTAVVTGGGTGIGRAIAGRLAAGGDRVVIVGRRRAVLEAAAAALNQEYDGRVSVVPADVTDPDQVAALAEALPERVDVLIHNAGGTINGADDSLAATADAWLETYRLNVVSAVLLTEALLARLARPGGRIVAVSSVAALRGAGAYGAAKAAMNTWITDLATQLAPDGITANAVAPGFVPDTEFWDSRRTPELVAQRVARVPMGRPGTPAEVAGLVAHLASEEAGFTTGQVVGIHGGTVLARL